MPAVELSDGEQVQRCGEEAEPCGKRHRMEIDGESGRGRAQDEPRHRAKQGWLSEFHALKVGRQEDDIREGHADHQHWHRHDEPGDRTGDADVEELTLDRDRLPDPDERAQGSRQDGRGQEIGQRGVDAVVTAGEVVTHFVAAQNRQDRQAVPETVSV